MALRYEASLLVGETPPGRRTWRPTLLWLGGVSALLAALGLVVLGRDPLGSSALLALGALALAAGTWLGQRERRRRRFVLDFDACRLRLDFVSPIAGRPRTMVVHFDAVRAVDLRRQGDGRHCLTVDFTPAPGSTLLLREVLVAFIEAPQLEAARRLGRLLEGAFGLGAPPPDISALDADSFQAGA